MLGAILAGLILGFVGSIPAAGPLALLIVRAGLGHDGRSGRSGARARALGLAIGGAAAESGWAMLALSSIAHVGARVGSLRVIGVVGAIRTSASAPCG